MSTQQDFSAALLDPSLPVPEGLIGPDGAPAGKRFDVYRNNVVVSLIEAMETGFPVIQKLLGAQNFANLARLFVRQHPPQSPVLMFYGDDFPEFLAEFAPLSHLPYLADVARLELAMRQSYHAADADAVDPDMLQEMAPDVLMTSTIKLAPSLRLIRSKWPAFSVWQFNMVEDAPKPAMAAEDIAVLRAELDPAPVLLPAGGGEFIQALLENHSLGDALEVATESAPEFDLSSVLALLIGNNAIIKIGAVS